jgi:hypothetical protein
MCWLLKRWWFWAGAAFILVVILAGYLLIPEPRISQANCDRIQNGWSKKEVEQLIGECSSWKKDHGGLHISHRLLATYRLTGPGLTMTGTQSGYALMTGASPGRVSQPATSSFGSA